MDGTMGQLSEDPRRRRVRRSHRVPPYHRIEVDLSPFPPNLNRPALGPPRRMMCLLPFTMSVSGPIGHQAGHATEPRSSDNGSAGSIRI